MNFLNAHVLDTNLLPVAVPKRKTYKLQLYKKYPSLYHLNIQSAAGLCPFRSTRGKTDSKAKSELTTHGIFRLNLECKGTTYVTMYSLIKPIISVLYTFRPSLNTGDIRN